MKCEVTQEGITSGYSLWFVPKGDQFDKYQAVIDSIAGRFGTPRFAPHVTLLGGLTGQEESLVAKTKVLAELGFPMGIAPLKLINVDQGGNYFKAVFVRAQRGNLYLLANERANTIFNTPISRLTLPRSAEGLTFDLGYDPHLSLAYGQFTPEQRAEIIEGLNLSLPDELSFNSVHLYRTEGRVEDWVRIGEFTIRNNS